jgi:hypothetical protein
VLRAVACLAAAPAQTPPGTGQDLHPAREGASYVSGIRYPMMVNGVPVVTTPAEIDVTTAEQLRTVLLRTADLGRATVGRHESDG